MGKSAMEGRVAEASHATESCMSLAVSLRSLAAAFGRVPAPRRPASVRYALAVLTLAVTAILAQQLLVLAMAEWVCIRRS